VLAHRPGEHLFLLTANSQQDVAQCDVVVQPALFNP
jgi:hypothetical protein